MENINTVEYWNKKVSGEWNVKQMIRQSGEFMQKIIDCIEKYNNEELNKLLQYCNVLDYGCGIAIGLSMLYNQYNNNGLYGYDFSDAIIQKNKELYPDIKMTDEINTKYETVICSNVIEHVDDSKKFLNDLLKITNKYLILMLPLEEGENLCEEHTQSFKLNNFPVRKKVDGNSFVRDKYYILDDLKTWTKKQIVIFYVNKG